MTTTTPSVALVTPPDRMDAEAATSLEATVQQCFGEGIVHFVLDLLTTTHISTAGIGAILRCAKDAQTRRGRMVLSGMSEQVSMIFEVSGVPPSLGVFTGQGEAIASFGAGIDALTHIDMNAQAGGLAPLGSPEA